MLHQWSGNPVCPKMKGKLAFNTLRPKQMAAIFRTAFSDGFSWMKMYLFRSRFRWGLFPRVKLMRYSSIGLDNGLAPTRRQAIIWTKDGKFTDAYMRFSAHCVNVSSLLIETVSVIDFLYITMQVIDWCWALWPMNGLSKVTEVVLHHFAKCKAICETDFKSKLANSGKRK